MPIIVLRENWLWRTSTRHRKNPNQSGVVAVDSCAFIQLFSQYRRLIALMVWLFTLLIMQNHGCLPFAWAKPVGSLFRTGKFRPGIAHSVQISSIYRKTAAKTWKWYQRWLFMQFCLNHSVRKNRKTFSDIPLLLFPIKRPKKSGLFTCQHDSFQKLFAIGKQLISQKSQWTPTWRGENEHCSYNFLNCKVFNCFIYCVVLVRKCKATGFSAEWK